MVYCMTSELVCNQLISYKNPGYYKTCIYGLLRCGEEQVVLFALPDIKLLEFKTH